MSNMNSNMKKMGRNLARVANQKASAKVPGNTGFAGGGVVPPVKDMGGFAPGIADKPLGGGKARGSGKATKGTRFSGTY